MKKRKFIIWIGLFCLIFLFIVLNGYRDGKEDQKADNTKQQQIENKR